MQTNSCTGVLAGVTLNILLAEGELEILYEFRFVSEEPVSIADNGKQVLGLMLEASKCLKWIA